MGALWFFFITVLRRLWSIDDTPYQNAPSVCRKVLSQQPVAKLLHSATTPFVQSFAADIGTAGISKLVARWKRQWRLQRGWMR